MYFVVAILELNLSKTSFTSIFHQYLFVILFYILHTSIITVFTFPITLITIHFIVKPMHIFIISPWKKSFPVASSYNGKSGFIKHRGQVFILHTFIFFSIFEIFLSSFLSFLILSLTRLHAWDTPDSPTPK